MQQDRSLERFAALHHGLITRAHGRALGLTPEEYARLVGRGWEEVSDRVLHRRGAPWTRGSTLCAHVFDAGGDAVLSHAAATSWWGIPGFRREPPSVATTARHARRSSLGSTHVVRALPTSWITEHRGIPIVRPELMILQLCATEHEGRAERALDNAWNLRLLSGPSLMAFLGQHGRRGRNGTRLLREFVDARGEDYIPPASNLEAHASFVLAPLGIELVRQVDLGGGAWTGRVDLVDRRHRLVIEVQSERYHSSLSDREADLARRRRLERDGFVVVEVSDLELWGSAAAVRAKVAAAMRDARSVLLSITDP